MDSIIPFAKDTTFNAEELAILGAAFDKTCAALDARGEPSIFREIIAKYMIVCAQTGVLDPDRLCRATLLGMGYGPMHDGSGRDSATAGRNRSDHSHGAE